MTSADYKLPVKINDYIQRHFRGEFLFKINSVRKTGNHTVYDLDIAQDEHIYHLKFDENGWLMRKEVEEAYPPDGYQNLGDTPQDAIRGY